ncbi:MAG TPA: hypothetical protein VH877_19990 [Polyangia bacterium]|nr:hypothetical protein [Polyangia bacterium]
MNQLDDIRSDALRLGQGRSDLIAGYLKPGETIEGFGYGGSESLTMFLRRGDGDLIVRKILSERLVTPRWDRGGRGVMLPPHIKARRQMEFLRGLPPSVQPYFPLILDVSERGHAPGAGDGAASGEPHEFVYDMSFVPGMEVSQFVRKYRPAPITVALLYAEIFRLLRERVHTHRRRMPRRPTLEASYFSKIEKRLALAASTAPKTFNDQLLECDEIVLNGRKQRNVRALLKTLRENERYREVLEPFFHSLVVGDTNTENVKIGNLEPLLQAHAGRSVRDRPFTWEDLELRFLDPRAIGYHEDGVDTGADDPMYDNKPWHNSLGHYDLIHGEHFELEYRDTGDAGLPSLRIHFHEDNAYADSYRGIGRYFAEVMTTAWHLDDPDSDVRRADPYWLIRFAFLMGTHFLAMPPFHLGKTEDGELIDDARYQRRPLAIYAEGIRWMNLALDMLEGRVQSYLGLPVPQIGEPPAASDEYAPARLAVG